MALAAAIALLGVFVVLARQHGPGEASFYEANPTPAKVIGGGLLLITLVVVLGLVWRVARRSTGVDVPGVVAACLLAVLVPLGALTVGPFIVPFVLLLGYVAMPLEWEKGRGARAIQDPAGWAPPGWHDDPAGDDAMQRYWNGREWTDDLRPTRR